MTAYLQVWPQMLPFRGRAKLRSEGQSLLEYVWYLVDMMKHKNNRISNISHSLQQVRGSPANRKVLYRRHTMQLWQFQQLVTGQLVSRWWHKPEKLAEQWRRDSLRGTIKDKKTSGYFKSVAFCQKKSVDHQVCKVKTLVTLIHTESLDPLGKIKHKTLWFKIKKVLHVKPVSVGIYMPMKGHLCVRFPLVGLHLYIQSSDSGWGGGQNFPC